MNKVYLYGLAGARDKYRVVRYSFIDGCSLSIASLMRYADWLKYYNPEIEHVYAIDNRTGLAEECKDAMRAKSIEDCVCFKYTLEHEGLMII